MTDTSAFGPPGDDREFVHAYLTGLEPEELVRRLVAIAERDEGLQLALVAEARAAAGILDLPALKKELTAMLRVSSRHLSWHGSRGYADEVESALDVLEGLLPAGHGEQVVALAEHVIKRLDGARP
jgi:hypothetical protein